MKPIALLALTTTLASGAGFQLQERSTRGLGRAFSGEAAISDDASVLASNPAGIIMLDDYAFAIGASFINPQADVTGNFNGRPTRSRDVGEHAVIPHIYLTRRYNDNVSYGFGIFTTYGLKSNYDRSFRGTILADESSLESVNLNGALALRIDDKLTIGLGLNLLYADGLLNSSFQIIEPFSNTLLPAGAEIEGDDFGVGFNIGALYEINDRTRIGLHYRSKVDLSLSGTSDFVNIPPFTSSIRTSLDVELPETIEFSIYHELNDKWAMHGDIVWTNWQRYNGISTSTGNPATDFSDPSEWNDAFRYSIGATYKYNDRLTLRTGLAYDQSPVSTNDRSLRIPDNDRFWASVGFSYQITDNTSIDVGYTHLFIDDADLPASRNSNPRLGSFSGTASGDVDIVSIGVSGTF